MNSDSDRYRLWCAGQGIAASLVCDYVPSERHAEDARQEVLLALWEATITWQEGVHAGFDQYAYYVMRRKLFHYLTEKASDKPSLTRREQEALKLIRQAVRQGMKISAAMLNELSLQTGIKRFRLEQIASYWYSSQYAVTACVVSQTIELFAEAEEDVMTPAEEQALDQAFNSLCERDRKIIAGRYLQDPKATLAELATQFGISIERVRVLEGKGLKKLKAFIAQILKD